MFVLHDCSVCFEDFDALRIPHSITCGHVFCRPCLDSLVASAPNCPNCRASFGRKSIRKVVCALQDPPTIDAGTLSETEMMMWQEIEGAVEFEDAHEQRRSLVRDNSKENVLEAGFSENLLIALDVMRLLVQVESANHDMSATHAVEESLRDRITFLEAQLNGTKATFSVNLQDFQTLLSKMQQLESSMCTTDEKGSQATDRMASTTPIPTMYNFLNPPLNHLRTESGEDQTLSHPQPTTPEITSSTEQQYRRRIIPVATPAGHVSPPSPTVARSSYQPDTPRTSNRSELSPAVSVSGNSQFQASPPAPWTWAQLARENSQAWGRQSADQRGIVSSSRSQPLSSTRTTVPPTIMVINDYTACEFDEISITAGETVSVIFEPDNIDNGREWILCNASGDEGFVPRNCLNARYEI
ncbi:hypothetical protein BDV93DRAFT_230815 [Ceratobasidium sp. AG-I]|nr:hypothetical protein BDV93DRAFT_230815 [Ceratobasidium sp. AG-I]